MIGTNRYIGSPVERIEDLRFLRGRGEYVGDLRRPGMLHAAILRSPIAHGRIRGLNAAAARATAGVRAVITAAEIGTVPTIPLRLLPLPGTERLLQPVIAADRVRYVGEPIAIVLADSAALAEDGVGAIALDIEELTPIVDLRVSRQHQVLLFEESGTKLEILRKADAVFLEEIRHAGLYGAIWQAFAVLLPVRSVGVMGDARSYDFVCALRAVTSTDGMTADYFPFPHEFLGRAATRIINEVRGINRVVYDVTSKPPGTIEWE